VWRNSMRHCPIDRVSGVCDMGDFYVDYCGGQVGEEMELKAPQDFCQFVDSSDQNVRNSSGVAIETEEAGKSFGFRVIRTCALTRMAE